MHFYFLKLNKKTDAHIFFIIRFYNVVWEMNFPESNQIKRDNKSAWLERQKSPIIFIFKSIGLNSYWSTTCKISS